MGDTQQAVSDLEELQLRRQFEHEVLPKVVEERAVLDRLRRVFQEISESVAPGTPPGTKKRDLAEQARERFEAWYHKLGFTSVTVPKPNMTNREFARRAKRRQALVYRPATREVSYEAFMAAVVQGDHWTVTDQDERAKIGWEPCAQGYWFWAEVQDDCPRLGTTWNDLARAIKLLSLEEYVMVWHATKAGVSSMASAREETKRMLDVRTWSWLRTRFGPGALHAGGCDGCVRVGRDSAEHLSISDGLEGGRALGVVG